MCQILRALLVLLKKGIYLIKQITLADLCKNSVKMIKYHFDRGKLSEKRSFSVLYKNYKKLIKQQLVSSVRAVRNYFQYFSYPFMIFQDNMNCEL